MAEVQLALQRGPAGFEKLVVVKLVHASLASQKAFVDMLLDEARVAALVKHPNVVDIYDLGQADGRYFIAMEYLEGEPLLAVLRMGREGKRLDVLSTGRLIADTAEGLDAAHELRSMSGDRLELVHHDISLGNIVVLYNGQVKLVDFGVAKATQAGPKSKVQGKFSYMAPEKLKGAPGDRRSDIFSLGCVMWEALTLKRLFRGGNDAETMRQVLEHPIQPPSKINGDVPPEYDPIVMRALERDPDKRQGTAKELAVEIEELLRKRGYGAKNDRIARYMQDTFRQHITARKKLVHEVVSKGSASAEVLDAAFSEPVLASGSPVTPAGGDEFSVKYRRVTPGEGIRLPLPPPTRAGSGTVPPPTPVPRRVKRPSVWPDPEDADQEETRIEQRPVHPMFDGGAGTATEIMPLRTFEERASKEMEVTRPPIDIRERLRVLKERVNWLFVAVVGGVLLVVILVVILFTRSSKPERAAEITVDAGVAHVAVAIDAAEEIEFQTPPDAAVVEVVPPPVDAAVPEVKHEEKKPPRPPPPPVPHIDVKDTVNKGLVAFVKGDAPGAIALLNKAKAAKPSYAPTYRVLGKVYKKQGNHAGAKKAFQKYLQLAPDADDAEQIREELKSL